MNIKAAELRSRCALPRAPLDAAGGHEVERGDAFGHARGVVVVGRHQHDTVTEPDALGALRTGGEEHLRGRRMGVFFEEVMLDLPGKLDAETVCQLHLIECLLEVPKLAAIEPRTGQLMLVEDAKAHLSPPCVSPELPAIRWLGCT